MKNTILFFFLLLAAAVSAQSNSFVTDRLRAAEYLRIGTNTSQKITGFDRVITAPGTHDSLPTSRAVVDFLEANFTPIGYYTAGTGISISDDVITNAAPDQVVGLTGGGITVITGTYPNFTITSNEVDGSTTNELQNLSLSGQSLSISSGTGVTLPVVGVSAGTGIGVSGSSGTFTVSNTGDLSATNELNTSFSVSGSNLALTDAGGTINVAVSSIAPVQAVMAGAGISISGTTTRTVTNTGDLSSTNEIQTLSLSGSDLSLSLGGGTVTLPGASGDYVNIETLGASGNGSADNTTIIRAALLQSKIVYVPPGTFVCDSIVVPEGRTILGAGENSILLFKTGSTGRFVDCRNGNVTLQNLVISGNESSTTYASTATASNRIGVYLKGDNNDTKILNAWIRGFNAAGISGNGASSNRERSPTITGCSILNCFIGISTNQGAAAGCEYLRIQNCNIGGCRIGIEVNSGNCIVSGNTISDNGYGVIVKSGGTGGNAGHGSIVSNLINHSTITGIVFLSTPLGYSVTGNNIFFGGMDITGDGVTISNNVLGFTTGDSLILRNGNNCAFAGNYIATSAAYISSIGSAWLYADNRTVSNTYVGGLFNPVFNGNASYDLSTNTLTAPSIVSTSSIFNNVSASSSLAGYIRSSNSAASTTQLNPGFLAYLTGGSFPHGMDLGYANSRYRTRIFTNNDISFARTTSAPTSQADFTDIMTIRGDNDRVGIGTQSPTEKLEVVGNIKASGGISVATLIVSGASTFSSRITAPDFRQTSNAGADLSNYFRTSNNAVSTTLLNPGVIFYESGNNFAHGADIGYSNGRFRTRLFSNNDISFAYAPGVIDEQSDLIDIMTIRGDSKTVGVGTQNPAASAILDLSSTTKGFLPTRMTSTQRDAISSPVAGLTLYCTDCTATDASTGVMQVYNGSTWKNCW